MDPRPRPDHADSLDAVLAEALKLLARGVGDRRHAFHTPTLATTGLDGTPTARTAVLRAFDPAHRTLRLHTDARAAKVAELARDPRAALHAYDAGAQIQLRLAGHASVHTSDALADAAWEASRGFNRRCYAIDPAPATPIEAPIPAPIDETARANFAAVVLTVHTLEWLWLAADGHRRARFTHDDTRWTGTWLVP